MQQMHDLNVEHVYERVAEYTNWKRDYNSNTTAKNN